jgi:hypothetical protein
LQCNLSSGHFQIIFVIYFYCFTSLNYLISRLLVTSITALVSHCFQVGVYVPCLFLFPSLGKTKKIISGWYCGCLWIYACVFLACIMWNSLDWRGFKWMNILGIFSKIISFLYIYFPSRSSLMSLTKKSRYTIWYFDLIMKEIFYLYEVYFRPYFQPSHLLCSRWQLSGLSKL